MPPTAARYIQKQPRVAHELASPSEWARHTIRVDGSHWKRYAWLSIVCQAVVHTVATGGRLAVFAPPQHGKSLFCSLAVPTWLICRYAALGKRLRVILASYNTEYASEWGGQCRDLLREYGARYGAVLKRGTVSKKKIALKNGSSITCAGLAAGITGRSADIFLVDDPIKNAAEADSERIREKVWREVGMTIESRLQMNAPIIWLQTLWNIDDPGSRIIKSQADPSAPRWTIIRLPAFAEDGDLLGRERGEALCPQRFTKESLLKKKASPALGSRGWLSMYQQRPLPDEGAIWKKSYFRMHTMDEQGKFLTIGKLFDPGEHTVEIASLSRFATVDLALGKDDGDQTVIQCWGWDTDLKILFLLHMWAGKMDSPATKRKVAEILSPGAPDYMRVSRVWVESTQYQLSFVQDMQHETWSVSELKPDKDKAARLRAVETWGEQRRISHNAQAHYRDDLEEQLLQFTGRDGERDDMVDAWSYGVRTAMDGKAGWVGDDSYELDIPEPTRFAPRRR